MTDWLACLHDPSDLMRIYLDTIAQMIQGVLYLRCSAIKSRSLVAVMVATMGTAVPPPPQEGHVMRPVFRHTEHPRSPSDHLLQMQGTRPVPSHDEHSGLGPGCFAWSESRNASPMPPKAKEKIDTSPPERVKPSPADTRGSAAPTNAFVT